MHGRQLLRAAGVPPECNSLQLQGKLDGDRPTVLRVVVEFTSVLKSINLRGNNLGTEGWCSIFHALRDNKDNKIESWDLSSQGINPEIASALAEYISVSSVLTSLNLVGNSLGVEGAKAIADALRVSASLTQAFFAACPPPLKMALMAAVCASTAGCFPQ